MMKSIILGQARHLLTAAAGVLVTNGYLQAAYTEAFVGIAIGLLGAGWSAIEKQRGR